MSAYILGDAITAATLTLSGSLGATTGAFSGLITSTVTGTGLAVVSSSIAGALISVKATTTAGYAEYNCLDSSGAVGLAFGYGNALAGLTAVQGKAYIQAGTSKDLVFFAGSTLLATLTSAGTFSSSVGSGNNAIGIVTGAKLVFDIEQSTPVNYLSMSASYLTASQHFSVGSLLKIAGEIRTPSGQIILNPSVSDSGGAVSISFTNANALTNTLAKITTWRTFNNTNEVAYVNTLGVFAGGAALSGAVSISDVVTPTNGAHTTATTGGTLVAGTYYYRVSATTAAGESLASAETSIVVPAGTSTNIVTVRWGHVLGATGYKVYGRTTGAELLIGTITVAGTTSFVDTGSVTPSGALPNATSARGTLTVSGATTVSGGITVSAGLIVASGALESTSLQALGGNTLSLFGRSNLGTTALGARISNSSATSVTDAARIVAFSPDAGTNDVAHIGMNGQFVGAAALYGAATIASTPTPVNATHTTATTGGTLVAGTYYYRVSATTTSGETLASTETSIVVPAGTSTNTVTVKWSHAFGATGYKVYGRTTGAELLIGTVINGSTYTFVDTGSVTPAGALPAVNSTGSINVTGSGTFSTNLFVTSTVNAGGLTTTVGSTGNAIQIQQGSRLYTNGATQTRWISDDNTNITFTGGVSLLTGILTANSGIILGASQTVTTDFITARTAGTVNIRGQAVDGASAVAVKITNVATLSTAGSKILSLSPDNGVTEKAFFAYTGQLAIPGVASGSVALLLPNGARLAWGTGAQSSLPCIEASEGAAEITVKNAHFLGTGNLGSAAANWGNIYASGLWDGSNNPRITTGTSGTANVYQGSIVNGAAAIAHKFININALSTAGAKIASFFSDAAVTEKTYIGWNGEHVVTGVAANGQSITIPTNTRLSLNGAGSARYFDDNGSQTRLVGSDLILSNNRFLYGRDSTNANDYALIGLDTSARTSIVGAGGVSQLMSSSGIFISGAPVTFGSNSASPGGDVGIIGINISRQVLVVKSMVGQISNMTDWLDSTGAILASINKDGGIATPGVVSGSDAITIVKGSKINLAAVDSRAKIYSSGNSLTLDNGGVVTLDWVTGVFAVSHNVWMNPNKYIVFDGSQQTYYLGYNSTSGYVSLLNTALSSPGLVTTAITTPVNGAFSTAATGGTLAAGTYYYRVSATVGGMETLASTQTSIVTTGTTSTVTVTWAQVTGATGYKIYGRTYAAQLLIGTILLGSTVSFIDTGAVTPAGALPIANSTGSFTSGAASGSNAIQLTAGARITFNTGIDSCYLYNDNSLGNTLVVSNALRAGAISSTSSITAIAGMVTTTLSMSSSLTSINTITCTFFGGTVPTAGNDVVFRFRPTQTGFAATDRMFTVTDENNSDLVSILSDATIQAGASTSQPFRLQSGNSGASPQFFIFNPLNAISNSAAKFIDIQDNVGASKASFDRDGGLTIAGVASAANAITIPDGSRLHFQGGTGSTSVIWRAGGAGLQTASSFRIQGGIQTEGSIAAVNVGGVAPIALNVLGAQTDTSAAVLVKIGNNTATSLTTAGAKVLALYKDNLITEVAYADYLGGFRTNASNAALPVASATYRGHLMFGPNAASTVADVLYCCMKGTADTYSWVAVATAP